MNLQDQASQKPCTDTNNTDPHIPGEDDVLDVKQAARLLKISPDQLTRLVRAGKIPHGVIGSRYRFSRTALLAHLAQTGRQGPIKPTRKLINFSPSQLIARVRKRGGSPVVKNGRLVLEGITRDQLTPKLWNALEKNYSAVMRELQKEQ